MNGLHELAGMVNRTFTLAEFEIYLRDEVAPKMTAWRPSMIVDHNTGKNPHWTKDTTAAQSVQLMKNSSVTWASAPNNWHSGPHLMIGPNCLIVAAWPLWMHGTHTPSWNNVSWGIEHAGDFDVDQFPDDYRQTSLGVKKLLFKMLGIKANDETYKHHHEDPETTHRHCPGVNFGPKASWLVWLNALSPAAKLLDLPHVDLTVKKPVPAGADAFIRRREGTRLVAYPDVGGFALGYGTNFKPDGTRVAQGDTCTLEQAEAWQSARTAKDWDEVQPLLSRPISDGLAIAILSFCYEFNVAKFAGSTFLKMINAGDIPDAATSLLSWDKVRDKNGNLVESAGIEKRRELEVALFLPNATTAVAAKPPAKPLPVVTAPAKTTAVAAKAITPAAARVTPPKPGTAPMAPRDAPVGLVATFVRWLENFILAHEVKKPAAGGTR